MRNTILIKFFTIMLISSASLVVSGQQQESSATLDKSIKLLQEKIISSYEAENIFLKKHGSALRKVEFLPSERCTLKQVESPVKDVKSNQINYITFGKRTMTIPLGRLDSTNIVAKPAKLNISTFTSDQTSGKISYDYWSVLLKIPDGEKNITTYLESVTLKGDEYISGDFSEDKSKTINSTEVEFRFSSKDDAEIAIREFQNAIKLCRENSI